MVFPLHNARFDDPPAPVGRLLVIFVDCPRISVRLAVKRFTTLFLIIVTGRFLSQPVSVVAATMLTRSEGQHMQTLQNISMVDPMHLLTWRH